MTENVPVHAIKRMNIRTKTINDIHQERQRQDRLHPQKLNLAMRFITAMEEAGEVAEALQEDDMQQTYKEAIETAASWLRFAEQVLEDEN